MEVEFKANYYAIIPACVRYNKNLKFAERLMYGEISALSNKEGFCFASNRYFAELYGVSLSTISRWISHLSEFGYIEIDLIRNEKNEVVERRLYLIDTYMQKNQYPMCKKSKDNNININKIDRLFNYIINKEKEIPSEFIEINSEDLFNVLNKYEMLYTTDSIKYISEENLNKIQYITYVLALIVKDGLQHLTNKVSRDKLIQIYNECKLKEKEYKYTKNEIENFINYFYKSVVNELTKDINPSFFMQKNKEIQEIGGYDI